MADDNDPIIPCPWPAPEGKQQTLFRPVRSSWVQAQAISHMLFYESRVDIRFRTDWRNDDLYNAREKVLASRKRRLGL